MNAVELNNVRFSYESTDENGNLKRQEVLKGINLTVRQGSFVALLGENGSGKSTLAKLINGLNKATEGKVYVFGDDVSDESKLFGIRKRVGMVFQNPDNQQIASIVEDDVAFGPENVGMKREDIGDAISYALKSVDMEEYRFSQISRLSGGQKQRIAVAGAIAFYPDVLILDEATSMLDPKGRRKIMEVVKRLNKEKNITVINITHYMDETVDADEIIVLSKGMIIGRGTPKEIFSQNALIERAGLCLPRATEIARKLKDGGIDIDGEILKGEDLADELCKLLQKI